MKTARELAHAHCAEESTGGDWCAYSGKHLAKRPHSYACDRLTAAIEHDRRETIEACAKVAEKSYRNDHANEVAAGGPDYDAVCWQARTARRRCAEDIRSLSPKGTT